MVSTPELSVRNPVSLPTSVDDWRMMVRTTRTVLSNPRFAVLSLVTAIGSVTMVVSAANPTLVLDTVVSGNLPLRARLEILYSLFPVVGRAYPLRTTVLIGALSALIGANASLVVYNLRMNGFGIREESGSSMGAFMGIVSVGCTACGGPIVCGGAAIAEIGLLFGITGVSSALAFFPFGGQEFLVAAFAALLLSYYWTAQGIACCESGACGLE